MPGYKRFKKKGYGGYRRRHKRPGQLKKVIGYGMSAMNMIKNAYYGVQMLKGIINSEVKRFDQGANGSISTTMAINHLSPIAQGNDINQRSGNSILGKYLTAKITFTINASATASNILCIIFQDMESTAGTPISAAQLLTSAANTNSPINEDFTQRVVVLKRFQVDLDNASNKTLTRECYIPLNFHIRFTGSAGANYDKNALFIALLSTEATNTPSYNLYTRLAYYDN